MGRRTAGSAELSGTTFIVLLSLVMYAAITCRGERGAVDTIQSDRRAKGGGCAD